MGTYAVTVNAISNGVSHAIPVTVTVRGSFISVPPLLYAGPVALVAIAVAIGAGIFLRSRRKMPKAL
jgi:hypothetical protein